MDWSDGLVVGGYSFLVHHLKGEIETSSSCRVEMRCVVKSVTEHANKTIVKTADGRVFDADFVVVTLPLAVLQGKHEESKVKFEPPLSKSKRDAILRMGMGAENKIVLRFKIEDRFWVVSEPYIEVTDSRIRILNLDFFGRSKGVLVVHMSPPFSRGYGGMSDDLVVKEVLHVLCEMYVYLFERFNSISQKQTSNNSYGLEERMPKPIETIVTRWEDEPFSGGSYSYIPVGASQKDIRTLAAPERSLLFAGEACSVEGHQCVHGAYMTGQDASFEILSAITTQMNRDLSKK